MKSNPLDLYDLREGNRKSGNKRAFTFITNSKKGKKQSHSSNPGKRNSSRRNNGYSKKSHSFSMTKKFRGLQKIVTKEAELKGRQHNQTPNNQIGGIMAIKPENSMKNTNNGNMVTKLK